MPATTPILTRITLINLRHSTAALARVHKGQVLTQRQVTGIHTRLCPVGACQCSDPLGRFGAQPYPKLVIKATSDGAWVVTDIVSMPIRKV